MTTRVDRRHTVVQIASFYPPHLGGVESVARTLAELLAERHTVEVVTTTCGSEGAPTREFTTGGVYVRRFRGKTVAHTPISLGLALRLFSLPRRSIVHAHVAQ